MFLIKWLVWIVGITIAIYVAGYYFFFNGAVDFIMAIASMFQQSSVSKDLAVTAVLNFMKLWVAGLVGWAIIFGTAMISSLVDSKDLKK